MSSTARPRIVSLVPAATEIVCALGCGDALVGRSHECDFPSSVARLPALTSAHVDSRSSSIEIDRGVKAALVEGLSLFTLDTGLLHALQPDLILTQDQCSICAVGNAEVEAVVARAAAFRPRVISLGATTLDGLWTDIRRVAAAIGVESRGEGVITELEARVRDVARRSEPVEEKPSVVCLEWLDPPMAGGHWTPELIELAGGRPLLGRAGQRAPRITWDEVAEADPDALVLAPCGFGLERVRSEAAAILPLPIVRALRAVRTSGEGHGNRVALMDGNQFINRSGPRLVDSIEILAEFLHPDLFSFGHDGWTTV